MHKGMYWQNIKSRDKTLQYFIQRNISHFINNNFKNKLYQTLISKYLIVMRYED